jgi:hypothetical protein
VAAGSCDIISFLQVMYLADKYQHFLCHYKT